MDLERYIVDYQNGIFLLHGLPKDIQERLQQEFKFRFQYLNKHKTAYYVKTDGNHTYLREW